MSDLIKTFEDFVGGIISEEGINPAVGFARTGDKKEVCALALPPDEIYEWFWTKICCEFVNEIVFGLDRTTMEGQGTEFADVFTVIHWTDDYKEGKWARSFRIGALNYQHEPRIVRPIDWDNEFWSENMTQEALWQLKETGFKYRLNITRSDKAETT